MERQEHIAGLVPAALGGDMQASPWAGDLVRLRARAPQTIVSHGDSVLVTGTDGHITAGEDQGLYVRETRVLSRHRFRINADVPLTVTQSPVRQDTWLGYYLLPVPGTGSKDEAIAQSAAKKSLELKVMRTIGNGMHEDVTLTNFSEQATEFSLHLDVAADFLGPDEVHGTPPRRGSIRTYVDHVGDRWEHVWDHAATRKPKGQAGRSIRRRLRLRVAAPSDALATRTGFRFKVVLAPKEQWRACLSWAVDIDGESLEPPPCGCDPGNHQAERSEPLYLRTATRFRSAESESAAPWLLPALERCRRDLFALRVHRLDINEEAWTVAAGIPAYMALFGRDSLTAGAQAALLGPEILRGSLEQMRRTQGTQRDDWRDEQPGRILHEARVDPAASLGLRPTDRYYGSLTSPSLFAIAAAQLWAWTGDRAQVEPYIEPALAALRWMDSSARSHHGHFYSITTRSSKGLDNQTWKDSTESVMDTEGRVLEQPVATCEEQGMLYLAKTQFGAMLRAMGRAAEGRKLQSEARELKKRFNDAYWVEDECYLAMALDHTGKQVTSVGSNALRCLASGIVDDKLAPVLAERAFQPDLFTGWGMRTLSSTHVSYNPYGYHRGAVWPVEHGPFALGLKRYGLRTHMAEICQAQFDLMRLFEGYRLPECIAGHGRDAMHPFPAVFPAANSPQAWSASAPLMMVQAMLGVEPNAHARHLYLDPVLPTWLPRLDLLGMRVGDATVDVAFQRGDDGNTAFEVLACHGELEVVRRRSGWMTDEAG